jgi:hypothetical protein
VVTKFLIHYGNVYLFPIVQIILVPLIYHIYPRVFIISKLSTMKKYFLKKLLLISIVLVLFSACKQKCDTEILVEPLLTAISIKEGSYFIYKDSVTSILDSVWIRNFKIENVQNWCEDKMVALNAPRIVASYNFNSKFNKSFVHADFKNNPELGFFEISTGAWSGNAVIVMDNTKKSIFGIDQPTQSIIILGKSYNNTSITNHFNNGIYTYTAYYDGFEGLVKICFVDNAGYHAWELQKSMIVR